MHIELHRYFGTHAYETLRDKRLMMARPSSLNDPFEFLYKNVGQITMSEARKYMKSRIKSPTFYAECRKKHPEINNKKSYKKWMRENLDVMSKSYFDRFDDISQVYPNLCKKLADDHFRISCFSSTSVRPHEEILMWSHYAAKHKGVRLRFLLDDGARYPYLLKKVEYGKERIGVDMASYRENEKVGESLMKAIITKAEGWSYECEYRMITLPSLCAHETGDDGTVRSFVEFNPKLVIQVDFGIDCPDEEISRISDLIKNDYSHASLRRATYHKSAYAIEYIKLT